MFFRHQEFPALGLDALVLAELGRIARGQEVLVVLALAVQPNRSVVGTNFQNLDRENREN